MSSQEGNRSRPLTAPKAPDPIAVEEIINYHRHQIPVPRAGQGIALDVRWGNGGEVEGPPSSLSSRPTALRVTFPSDGTSAADSRLVLDSAILQVGLATAKAADVSDLLPLNLVLVIDRSGSMASAGKMNNVKASLRSLLGKLRRSDLVSIVVFDDQAEILVPSGPVGDGAELRRAVDRIQPRGSTNIDDGLQLGYREANRNFRKGSTNRVILLTDGIANTGETNPDRIAANSAAFNERGIDLTTIGLGEDLDNNLLRTLAKRGHGLYHFVADARDVEKVFVREAQSLLSAVARGVRVEITSDPGLRLEQLFGYEPAGRGGRITLDLDDMNSDATQVILLRYSPQGSGQVTVQLSYFDIARQRMVEETRRVNLPRSSGSDPLRDPEVRKNFTIATIAQALSDMQGRWQRGDLLGAENLLHVATRDVRSLYGVVEDADIRAQFDVAENYLTTLQTFNQRDVRPVRGGR